MPYSKNVDKYPEEMLRLLEAMRTGRIQELRIPFGHSSEMNAKRIQFQAFFCAVEKRAADLRKAADALALKKQGGPRDKVTEMTQDAEAIAGLWEDRAATVVKWMVKAEPITTSILICKRQATGSFGDSLRSLLQQIDAADAGTPSTATAPTVEAPQVPLPSVTLDAPPTGPVTNSQGMTIEEQIAMVARMPLPTLPSPR